MQAEIKNTKARKAGRIAILGGAALLGVLASQQQAFAQCTVLAVSGANVYQATPVGPAAVNALVSVIGTVNTAFLTQSSAFVSAPGNPQPDQPGGGIWTRGVGGHVDTTATGNISNFVFNPGGPAAGSFNCTTTVHSNFAGYQSGVDIARLNFGGSGGNAHLGVTGGYLEANSTSGTFSGKFEVPFVGIYGAFTRGGLFADGQVRWDFYHNTISDAPSALTNQNMDARSVSVTANLGYQQPLPNNWFVEPSVGIVYSKTYVSALNVAGAGAAFDPTAGDVPPGTVQITPIESALGRASLRVGTNITSGNLAWQPFATASVFHEFSGNTITNLSTCLTACGIGGGAPDLTSTLSTSRVGTYGQFALGVAGQVLGTGWLGYVRGDYRKGDDIEGWSVNGGVRYQFTPEQMARTGVFKAKAPAMPVVQPVNWTGFYVGGNVGTLWTGASDGIWSDVDGVPGANTRPRARGFIGGGQVGFNYQINSIVLGVEGDYDWSNARGSKSCPDFGGGVGFFFTCHSEVRSVATAAGRLGFVWDRTLIYGKGGAAWIDAKHRITDNSGLVVAPGTTLDSATDRRTGWVAGGGFEFALTQNWSAKAEYNYMNFGTRTVTLTGNGFTDPANIQMAEHAVKIGANYRFGMGQ